MPLCGKSNNHKIFITMRLPSHRFYLGNAKKDLRKFCIAAKWDGGVDFDLFILFHSLCVCRIRPHRAPKFFALFAVECDGDAQRGKIYDHREQDLCALYLILYKREIENISNSFASVGIDTSKWARQASKRAPFVFIFIFIVHVFQPADAVRICWFASLRHNQSNAVIPFQLQLMEKVVPTSQSTHTHTPPTHT